MGLKFMKKTFQILAVLMLTLLFSTSAFASMTRYVGTLAGDIPTIQQAVVLSTGGDTIKVRGGTYFEKVNILSGRNALVIEAANPAQKPVITGVNPVGGALITLPAIGIMINSDDVVLRNLVVKNFNHEGRTTSFDPEDFLNYGGAAIYTPFNKTNLTIEKVDISNCNWGIYLSEPVACNVLGNTIENIMSYIPSGSTVAKGGIGIIAISLGASIDGNIIGANGAGNGNTIRNCQRFGIWFGYNNNDISIPNVSADISYIQNNKIRTNNVGGNAIAIDVQSVVGVVNIDHNTLDTCDIGLKIDCMDMNSCEDLTVHHNKFRYTVSSSEIIASANFSGEKFWDIWRDMYNDFDENGYGDRSDSQSATERTTRGSCAVVDLNLESILVSQDISTTGSPIRIIRNKIYDAVKYDADLDAGHFYTDAKIEILPGKYAEDAMTIDYIQNFAIMGVKGNGTLRPKIVCSQPSGSTFMRVLTPLVVDQYFKLAHIEFESSVPATQNLTTLEIGTSYCEVFDNDFSSWNQLNGDVAQITVSAVDNVNIHDNIFRTVNKTGAYFGSYSGINLLGFVANGLVNIEKNEFYGRFSYGISIMCSAANVDMPITINCNKFETSSIYAASPFETSFDVLFNTAGPTIQNVLVKYNTFNCLDGATLLNGIGITTSVDNVVIANNKFIKSTTGLATIDALGLSVNENWFGGVYANFAVNNLDVANILNADNNWWKCQYGPYRTTGYFPVDPANCIASAAHVNGLVDYTPWLTTEAEKVNSSCGNGFNPVTPIQNQYPVWTSTNNDATGLTGKVAEFPSIKSAVEAAGASINHIFAKNGIYIEESITIAKAAIAELTISGVSADNSLTVVKPFADYQNTLTAWIGSYANTVNFANFTFDGTGKKIQNGLGWQGANGDIDNCHFTAINNPDDYAALPSPPFPAGLYSGNYAVVNLGLTTPSNVNVHDSKFDNIGKNAIYGSMPIAFVGSQATGEVAGNLFDGGGSNAANHSNQVFCALGAGAITRISIYDNKFTNINDLVYLGYRSYGVWIDQSSFADVYQNDFDYTGSTMGCGVRVGSSAGDISSANVYENKFVNNTTAIAQVGVGTVIAINNYFNSNNGPKHISNTFNVAAQGERVSGSLDYTPYWTTLGANNINDVTVTKPKYVHKVGGGTYYAFPWGPVVVVSAISDAIDETKFYPSIQTAQDAALVGDFVLLVPTPFTGAALFTESVAASKDGLHYDKFQTTNPFWSSTYGSKRIDNVTCKGTNASTFTITGDNIFVDSLIVESAGLAVSDYPFFVNGGAATYLHIGNCFINSVGTAKSGVYFRPNNGLLPPTDYNYGTVEILKNHIRYDEGDVAINFDPDNGNGTTSTINIAENFFEPFGVTNTNHNALLVGMFTNQCTVSANRINSQIEFAVNTSNNLFISGNTFLGSATAGTGILFYKDKDNITNQVIANIRIEQNEFNARENAIWFYTDLAIPDYSLADANINYATTVISENKFYNYDLVKVTVLAGLGLTGPFDCRNNYWGGSAAQGGLNGPRTAIAYNTDPAAYCFANVYNYTQQYAKVQANDGAGDARFNVAPWWSTVSGTVGTFVGTSWAPLWSNQPGVEPTCNFKDMVLASDNLMRDVYVADGIYNESFVVNKYSLWFNGRIVRKDTNIVDYQYFRDAELSFYMTMNTNPMIYGAKANGPKIIYDNVFTLGQKMVTYNNDDITFVGFNFDLTGNARTAIEFTSATTYATPYVYNNTFILADASDKGINITNGASIAALTVEDNVFNGPVANPVASCIFVDATSGNVDGIGFAHNQINACISNFYLGAAGANKTINDVRYLFNDFNSNKGCISIVAPAISTTSGVISNILIGNNRFFKSNFPENYALSIRNLVDDNVLGGNWNAGVNFINNAVYIEKPASSSSIFFAVGFAGSFVPSSGKIYAGCNWWGSENGPTVPSNNGATTYGAKITEGVEYIKWSTADLNIPPALNPNRNIGYWPAWASCNGWWVFTSDNDITGDYNTVPDNQFFGSITEAMANAQDGFGRNQIWVKYNADMQENVTVTKTVTLNSWPVAEDPDYGMITPLHQVNVNGTLTMLGDNKVLSLGDDAQFKGINTDGNTLVFLPGTNRIDLGTSNLMLFADGFGGTASSFVNTNSTGSLKIVKAVSSVQYRLPIGYKNGAFSAFMPVYIALQNPGFTNQTIGARVKNTDFTVAADILEIGGSLWGELNNPVHALWNLTGPTNANAQVDFFYPNSLRPIGFNIMQAYGARWKGCTPVGSIPCENPWESYRMTSTFQGSLGTTVTNVNQFSPWAIFWGPSSYATSKEPERQASNIMFTEVTDNLMKIRWTRGSGLRRVVVVREYDEEPIETGFVGNELPVEGTDYQEASKTFDGKKVNSEQNVVTLADCPITYIGAKAKVIYDGTGNNLELNGLNSGKFYKFQVFEYNGTGDQINYNHKPSIITTVTPNIYTNPRYRKTMPACTLSVAVLTSNTYGKITSTPFYHNLYTYGHTAEICGTTGTFLRFEFTGSAGTTTPPTGWKLKYSNGTASSLISPNAPTSPFYYPVTVDALTDTTKYTIVSAFDGDNKMCVNYYAGVSSIIDPSSEYVQVVRHIQTTTDIYQVVTLLGEPLARCVGGSLSIRAIATAGYPTSHLVRWEKVTGGVPTTLTNGTLPNGTVVTGATTNTITLSQLHADDNGTTYRAIFSTSTICSPTSEVVTANISITVNPTSVAGGNPQDATVCNGTADVTFVTTTAGSVGVISWEYKTALLGSVFQPVIAGLPFTASGNTLTVPTATLALDGYQFRAVYKSGVCSEARTNAATLRVVANPAFGTFSAYTVPSLCSGASTSINVTGTDFNRVEWFSSVDGYTNPLTVGGTSPAIAITQAANQSVLTLSNIPATYNNATFRVKLYNDMLGYTCGTVLLANVTGTLTVQDGPWTDHVSQLNIICDNGTTSFLVEGTNFTQVKWYRNGTEILPATGIVITNDFASTPRTTRLTLSNVPTSWNGSNFYAVISNGICSYQSATDLLQVNTNITVNPSFPQSQIICDQSNIVTFHAEASAVPAPNVVWQYKDGSSWINIVLPADANLHGAQVAINSTRGLTLTTTNLVLSQVPMAWWNGREVRAFFTDFNGKCAEANSVVAALNVNPLPVQPASVTANNLHAKYATINWVDNYASRHNDYRIEIYSDAAYSNLVTYHIALVGVTSWEIPDNTLDKNTQYWFRIRSRNICDASEWTNCTAPFRTTNPTLAINPGYMDFGDVAQGQQSNAKLYRLTGRQLEGSVTVTPDPRIELSLNPSGPFTTTLPPIDHVGGNVDQDIYVVYHPELTDCDFFEGYIYHASKNVTDVPTLYAIGRAVSAAPTVQAYNINFTNEAINGQSIRVTWENGSANPLVGRILVMHTGYPATWWTPTINEDYSAGTAGGDFANATDVGNGFKVVYDGNGSQNWAVISGIQPGTVYQFRVYEYTVCGTIKNYFTATAVKNPNMPKYFTIDPLFLNQQVGVPEAGEAFPVIIRSKDRAGVAYTAGSPTFSLTKGLPAMLGDIWFYNGTTFAKPISGSIAAGTDNSVLSVKWDETYSGVSNAYMNVVPPSAPIDWFGNVSNQFNIWAKEPIDQARSINWVGTVPCNKITISWVKGKNGTIINSATNTPNTYSLLVVKKGMTPDSAQDWTGYPSLISGNTQTCTLVDTTTHPETNIGINSTWGTWALYKGDKNQITVNGLTGLQTYHFRIYAYNSDAWDEVGINKNINYNRNTGAYNPRPRTMPACSPRLSGLAVSTQVEDYRVRSAEGKAFTSWSTTFEQGIAGFEVYRLDVARADAEYTLAGSYMQKSELQGLGYNDNGRDYRFVDADNKLEIGRTYYYQLIAIGIDGSRFEVEEAEITILNTQNTAAQLEVSAINPNPVSDYINFNITLASEQNVIAEVIDLTGRTVATLINGDKLNSGLNPFSLPLEGLNSGVYMLTVKAGQENASQKFIYVK